MAYNDTSEYPRGIAVKLALTDTAVTVSTTPIKISGILIINTAAASESIDFRQVDDAPVYFTITTDILIGSQYFPLKVELPDLEIISTSGDVDVTIFFENGGSFSHTIIA